MIHHADVYRQLDRDFEWLTILFFLHLGCSLHGWKRPKINSYASCCKPCTKVLNYRVINPIHICLKLSVLTINANHLGGNLLHRHKNIRIQSLTW